MRLGNFRENLRGTLHGDTIGASRISNLNIRIPKRDSLRYEVHYFQRHPSRRLPHGGILFSHVKQLTKSDSCNNKNHFLYILKILFAINILRRHEYL